MVSTDGGASFSVHPTGLYEMSFDIHAFITSRDTVWAGIEGGGVCRSTDGGITWSVFNDGFTTQSFVVGLALLGDTLYATVDYVVGMQPSGVYKTSVQQANWTRCGAGFPEGAATITAIAVTPLDVMVVGIALGVRGNAFVSTDKGETWYQRSIAGIQGILCLATFGEMIYAGTTHGFYVTADYGQTWMAVGSELQGMNIDRLLLMHGILIAAVDRLGVAISKNGGATWSNVTGNLPIEGDYVNTLSILDNKLFAGLSPSHGIWSAPLSILSVGKGIPSPGSASLHQNYPNPFAEGTTLSFHLPVSEVVRLTVFDALGREVATLIDNEMLQSGNHAVAFRNARLTEGVYYYKLQGSGFSETKKMMLAR